MAKGTRGFVNIMALLPGGVVATSILSLRVPIYRDEAISEVAIRLPRGVYSFDFAQDRPEQR